jgi:hypothetical protein
MTEVEAIAARYGAIAKPGLQIKRVPPGVSGLPSLEWDARRGLTYTTKPNLQRLSFGAPPQPCEYRGVSYPSMTAAALANGVSIAAVSKAVKKAAMRMAA